MKKVTSLFLLSVFLFGLVGYYGVYWILSEKAHNELANRLDENRYLEEETITIKYPLSLAYPINSSDFERVDGSFQYNGEFYKLVKQKLDQDTLYVICIKDNEKKELTSLFSDIVKLSHEQSASSSSMKLLCSFSKDFTFSTKLEVVTTHQRLCDLFFPTIDSNLITVSYPVLKPPPEV